MRYVLDDDFGGWLKPRAGASSYFISTSRQGTQANRFRALIYAPGCMIQTIDLPIVSSAVPRYSFVCQPLRNVTLTGTLIKPARLDGQEINVQVKYVARWAQRFLGLDDGIIPDIPFWRYTSRLNKRSLLFISPGSFRGLPGGRCGSRRRTSVLGKGSRQRQDRGTNYSDRWIPEDAHGRPANSQRIP
jgi:hypothetical protein